MLQKILGLDIGSYSIKAALFETTFRSYELTDLFESAPLSADEIAPEDRPVVITEAILRLLQEHSIDASTVVTAISGMGVSTRVLTLPLPARQVSKVLPFELEPFLPFDLDEIIVDHHLISSSPTESVCLAAAVKKAVLAEHIALVKNANLDPAFVGLDSLMLYNLSQMTLVQDLGTYAIVDIGHQKTSVCVVSNGNIQYVRTIFTAGKTMTDTIREELDLTLEQAIEVKHNHGILEMENQPLKSPDLRRLSAAIRTVVDPLIREVLQTFHAYRAQVSKGHPSPAPVERIYLCGGGSLLRNLPEYMNSITNVPVSRLQFFPEEHEVSRKLGKKEPVLAQAVALGLRAAARGAAAKHVASLNFRKNEFSFARDFSGLKEKAVFFSKWISVIFVLALLHVSLRYENLSRQNSRVEATVLRTFREIAPDVQNPPKNSTAALKILEDRIQKFREKQEVLTAGLNEMTALRILREISALLPPDLPIDTQELTINRNTVTIRANTDSLASVDRIITSLQQHLKFKKIERGDTRESADGKKTFQITMNVGDEEAATKERRKP